MTAAIDEAYLRRMVELPDGWTHLHEAVMALIAERDTAQAIAAAVVRDAEPTRRRIDHLLAANSELVQEKRDLCFEMQAELDAAYGELDSYRTAIPVKLPLDGLQGLIERLRVHAVGWRMPGAVDYREPDEEAGLLEDIAAALELIAKAAA